MIEPLLFENLIGNWLWAAAKEFLVPRRKNQWPDFELRSADGTRFLVEVKTKAPNKLGFERLEHKLKAHKDRSAQFLLVTPTAPNKTELTRFREVFKDHKHRAQWLTVDQLPELLGKAPPGPWDSPKTWSDLQTKALLKGLEEYRGAPIGPDPTSPKTLPNELEALARQFSYKAVAHLNSRPGTLEQRLGLGTRRDNVTVVLSDMVNFSSLVTASRPDDLREAMGQYYQRARQSVFEHDGMLDKFIGDAVLAVFGYPEATKLAPINAIRFAIALVEIGQEITESWQAELNAVIPTGTRVGIATGDIWPINIGRDAIEVSLLGDTINLAARLEKNCPVDRFLIGNRTHTAASRADATFIKSLELKQTVIPPADAKGQAFAIKAWVQP
jgi:adenylate cyclase